MLQVIKKTIWRLMPKPVKHIVRVVYATLRPYKKGDNSLYWRGRAKCEDQKAVLWQNNDFNELYRVKQKEIIRPFINDLPKNSRILDIGCGIGVVSEMIADIRDDVSIDAVDFEEMIEIAQKRISGDSNINLLSSSAEQYLVNKQYKLIISSGCYSAIRDLEKMYRSIDNGTKMLESGGIMLMIDPFHRWKYLARARASSKNIEKFLQARGLVLVKKSGVLFWPYRDIFANSNLERTKLEKKFEQGEKLLSILGKHRFADYKILAFKKSE